MEICECSVVIRVEMDWPCNLWGIRPLFLDLVQNNKRKNGKYMVKEKGG